MLGLLSVARGAETRSEHVGTIGIGIAEEWRNKGVGTALMAEAFRWQLTVELPAMLERQRDYYGGAVLARDGVELLRARQAALSPCARAWGLISSLEYVEAIEGQRECVDAGRVGDVDLAVVQARQIGVNRVGVIDRGGPCAPHMNGRATCCKGTRDAVADAARAADHQHGLAAEIERIGESRSGR